ncbi:hypothetical protein KIN20_006695 [Parelaphostrongylus tenuis]|uniref:Uncharacterized protein n=1 Tax=Parelaphostrongylus tenuis TaxID=148309 RepID=A0AAD5MNF0_PARTN|nr:hypothetical protein KIN20_006695 [Parelaphostrongylus tenuis]
MKVRQSGCLYSRETSVSPESYGCALISISPRDVCSNIKVVMTDFAKWIMFGRLPTNFSGPTQDYGAVAEWMVMQAIKRHGYGSLHNPNNLSQSVSEGNRSSFSETASRFAQPALCVIHEKETAIHENCHS